MGTHKTYNHPSRLLTILSMREIQNFTGNGLFRVRQGCTTHTGMSPRAGVPSPAATSTIPDPIGAAFPRHTTARPMFRPRSHFSTFLHQKSKVERSIPKTWHFLGRLWGCLEERECCAQPPTTNTAPQDSRLTPEWDTRAGTQWKIIKCSCQPPLAPPTATFGLERTGGTICWSSIWMPPSLLHQYPNRGQARTLRLVF